MNRTRCAAAAMAVLLAVAGCSNVAESVGGQPDSPERNAAAQSGPDPASIISSSVKDGAQVAPGSQVTISAASGWAIRVISGGTENVLGAVKASGAWVSDPLPPNSSWLLRATAVEAATGKTVTRDVSGATSGSRNQLTAEISPSAGTYGVGIIPRVTFSDTVRKSDRARLEKRMDVTSSVPVTGDWYWETSNTAAYRPTGATPNTFWPGRSTIAIKVDLNGAYAKGTGKDIAFGSRAYTRTIKTGRAMIIYVNGKTVRGYATIDGKKKRTFPVSLGKSGYITRSGIKTITEKDRVLRMTNVGVTTEEVYDLQVPYAMRITDTGEFFHGAPWNGNIGYANTSHGCTNLEVADAAWFYDRTIYGDPLITTGTSRKMESTNGQGAAWNISWKKWLAG